MLFVEVDEELQACENVLKRNKDGWGSSLCRERGCLFLKDCGNGSGSSPVGTFPRHRSAAPSYG